MFLETGGSFRGAAKELAAPPKKALHFCVRTQPPFVCTARLAVTRKIRFEELGLGERVPLYLEGSFCAFLPLRRAEGLASSI